MERTPFKVVKSLGMLLKNLYNSITSSKKWIIVFLFSISFIIRLGFLTPFTIYDIPLMTDENEYFDFAVGFENILTELSHGHLPSANVRERAYGFGQWPPLHPFFLGLGFFLFGKHIIIARLLMVVVSAMTTPVVYLLTSRLSTGKAAIIAAFIHIFYLSFIGYSHYLLSETTYIFLLLLAVYFTVLLFDAQIHREKIMYAVFSGLFLGLSGLTRAAVLPFLFVVPLWLAVFLKGTRLKILLPSIVILSYVIMLLPWQTYLILKEKNPGLLSNISGWYLHIGNNPWIPDGYGTSWQHDSRGLMLESAKEYREIHSVTIDKAQRMLALQEIKRDFKAFLIRGIYKLRMFWSMDFFVLIHIFYAAYPPMHPAIVVLIWSAILISYITLLVLAVSGFLIKGSPFSKKSLILVMVIAGMAPSFIAFGISRFHIPLLALLLPVAGYGAANLKQTISFKRTLVITPIIILLFVSIFTSLPLLLSGYLKPSTHYCGLISRVDKILGSNTACIDKVIFRATNTYPSDSLIITTPSKGYLFNLTQKDMWIRVPQIQKYTWKISPENKMLRLDIYAHNTSVPLEMSIFSERLEQSVAIQPIRKHSWRKWLPSGLNGIEYMWLGGGMGVRNKLPDDKLYMFK